MVCGCHPSSGCEALAVLLVLAWDGGSACQLSCRLLQRPVWMGRRHALTQGRPQLSPASEASVDGTQARADPGTPPNSPEPPFSVPPFHDLWVLSHSGSPLCGPPGTWGSLCTIHCTLLVSWRLGPRPALQEGLQGGRRSQSLSCPSGTTAASDRGHSSCFRLPAATAAPWAQPVVVCEERRQGPRGPGSPHSKQGGFHAPEAQWLSFLAPR